MLKKVLDYLNYMNVNKSLNAKNVLNKITVIEISLFFPFLLFAILGIFYIPFLKAYLKEIISFFLLSSIFLCFILLTFNKRLKKILLFAFSLLLSILVLLKISFYYHYAVKLSASALFVIFETNNEEASEFFVNYLDGFVKLIIIILGLFLLFIFRKVFLKNRNYIRPSKVFNILLIIWFPVAAFLISYKFSAQNVFLVSTSSYKDYKIAKKNLKDNLAKPISDLISVTQTLKIPQTYVVIIGESTSKWHMQLYGYPRETNPNLNNIKDQLLIYQNVISPNVHTILALDKVLTLSNYANPNKKDNASIVQLANAAGFTTYWLSNQRPVGINESVSTIIGSAANYKYFLATDNYDNNIYDEKLLPQFDTLLSQNDSKKVIFIHLIGTHLDYKKRYPSKFKYFTGQAPNNKFRNSNSEKVTNEYDNAVRYNDSIINEIIARVKNRNEMSYVLYFSDHGDEVFDTMDLVGHNEYYGSKPMYEIPLLIWLSDKYKNNSPLSMNYSETTGRKYIMEDFINSFSELSHINFNLMDSTKSIFSNKFKEKIRLIKNNEDYDKK